MRVSIEIRDTIQAPAGSNAWPESAGDKNIIVEIPYRCLKGAAISKHVVRVTVTVKITQGSPGLCQHVVTDTRRSFTWVCRLRRGSHVRLRLFCCPTGLQRVAGMRDVLMQLHAPGERRACE